jgi:uncharacterized NAD(P)/FAD-binding protein YdhS
MSNENIHPADISFDDDTVIEDVDLNETEVIVDGERLTDERAEQIAADVLNKARAYNRHLVPGGKSLSGGRKHSPVVQVRVSEATRDKLQAIAAGRKMSLSKLSRQVLDDFVAHNS